MVATSPEARLLVVDDEPNIVELLSASLRFVGFEVATATDGTEAVTVARRNRPDLLVLDVMMPGMDGFDLVRKLRGEGLRMPVLFLTARDTTADRVAGLVPLARRDQTRSRDFSFRCSSRAETRRAPSLTISPARA